MTKCIFGIFVCLFWVLLNSTSIAQKFTVSGYLEDAESGEKLIGAHIYETKLLKGTTTNLYGFYSLTFPSDTINLTFSYIGYQTITKQIILDKDLRINISLSSSIELGTVEIVGERLDPIEERSQMSIIEIPVAQVKLIPALLGEVDVLKALQLLPGVQSGGEGSSGLYVRGGGPDQNLILLDGAPVYNVSHLFGFFSVFNADAIKNIQLTKGGFPARYGGRLSSVLEINMKEGNMKKIAGEGSIGLIASRLTIEGPIKKDKTSFIVSGRRTYIDLLIRPLSKAASQGAGVGGYYFYDINAKANHIFSDKDRIYFSVYAGNDRFFAKASNSYLNSGTTYESNVEFNLGWGNITSALRWNHIINSKLFSNVAVTYSKYKFYVNAKNENIEKSSSGTTIESYNLKHFSGVRDWSGKIDFDFLPSPDHYIKFGTSGIYHTFNTGAIQFKTESINFTTIDTTLGVEPIDAGEFALYFEDDIRFTARLKANAGVHLSGFLVNGQFYYSVQPRLSLRYFLTDEWAVKGSYAIMNQYIHLLSNSGIDLPTDLWVPTTDIVKPQRSQQVAAGVARSIFDNKYELSIEAYYKTMNNLIEYSAGANFLEVNSDWQQKIEVGKGWSYGAELFIQKKSGKTTGWIGYTLSWSNRQFENLNFGKPYPYKYDRRHDFSIVISHKIDEHIDLSATWVYGTGNAISLPIAHYQAMSAYYGISGNEIQYYVDKNSFRMRAYHRLDFGVNFHKKKKWGERTWSIGVYNMYNRKNPYFLYFSYDNQGNRQLKQVSLFPLLPSVSYGFKF